MLRSGGKGYKNHSAPSTSAAPPAKRQRVTCTYCKKFGHSEDDCRKKLADQKADGALALRCVPDRIRVYFLFCTPGTKKDGS